MGLDKIYVSPYLRALQIAQHIGWVANRKLLVEPGLGNAPHSRTKLPTAKEFFMSFPSVDLHHCPASRHPHWEDTVLESLPRMLDVGLDITEHMSARQKIALVTHSVSAIALVAGLVAGCTRSCYEQEPDKLNKLRHLLQVQSINQNLLSTLK